MPKKTSHNPEEAEVPKETPQAQGSTLAILRGSVAALLSVARQTQNQLASGTRLSNYAVSRRQSGASPWSFDEADAIARHFGISTLTLLAGAETACEAYASTRESTVTELFAAHRDAPSIVEAPTTPSAPTSPEPHANELASTATDDVTDLPTAAPCVLCGLPAATTLEGFPQHVSADECEAAKTAAQAQTTLVEVQAGPETSTPEAPPRPRSSRPGRPDRPRQERSDTKDAGVTFMRNNIGDWFENAE